MNLSNSNRELIHSGTLLRFNDSTYDVQDYTELFAFLFDNYCAYSIPAVDETID